MTEDRIRGPKLGSFFNVEASSGARFLLMLAFFISGFKERINIMTIDKF